MCLLVFAFFLLGYAAAHAARPPLQKKHIHAAAAKTHTRRVFLLFYRRFFVRGMHVFFVLPMVWVFLFALNLYGNAQAGALLILHIARLV